eukprot:scaffold2734_cov243-Ochromonas_danica.AAC.7
MFANHRSMTLGGDDFRGDGRTTVLLPFQRQCTPSDPLCNHEGDLCGVDESVKDLPKCVFCMRPTQPQMGLWRLSCVQFVW